MAGGYQSRSIVATSMGVCTATHPAGVPRGIIADIIADLGITREQFYQGKF